MKKLFYLFILINSYDICNAQQRALKGKVTDKETHEPLPGATISIRNSEIAVATNKEGDFTIPDLPTGTFIVVVHYVGYKTSEHSVSFDEINNHFIDVRMSSLYRTSDSIVISASKRPEKITDAPASIHVIGQKELQQFSGSNVGELVAYVQGVEFVRMGVDNVSFNARGLNNAFNGKVFQIVDGRNSMQPLSGNLMMGNNISVNKEDIEKVEVLLGPQTALYGPNVHNALFNYITKDPRKYQGTSLGVSAGNQNQFSARIRHGEKINDKWAYKLTGEYAVGRDFEFYDSITGAGGGPNNVYGPVRNVAERIDFDFKRLRGEAHVYYNITPTATAIVSTGGSKTNTINTHTGGHNQFVDVTNHFVQVRFSSPRFFATFYNAWADFGNSYNVGLYTRTFWNRTHSSLRDRSDQLYPSIGHLSAEEADQVAKVNSFKETPQRLNAEVQYNYTFPKQQLFIVAGLTYQKDKPRGYGINLVDSFRRIYVTQYGAVLQIEKKLPWKLRLIGAARFDNHSNFGNFLSPKLGLVTPIGNGNFRVTWGLAYSMPSILYQYASTAGFFFGNGEGITYIPNGESVNDESVYKTTTPLFPEKVSTWEIGYKGTFFQKLNVDFSYYNSVSNNFFTPQILVLGRAIKSGNANITHKVGRGYEDNGVLRGASFATIFNFGEVKVYGVDVGTNYQFNRYVNLAVKYSWLGSDISKGYIENDANGDKEVAEDERSLNSPRNTLVTSLNFQNLLKQKVFINFTVRYVEEYDFHSGMQISTKAGEGRWGEIITPGGKRYTKNFNWGPLGGTTVDISTGYQLNGMVSFTFGVTNLFDTNVRQFAGSSYIHRLYQAEVRILVPSTNKPKTNKIYSRRSKV